MSTLEHVQALTESGQVEGLPQELDEPERGRLVDLLLASLAGDQNRGCHPAVGGDLAENLHSSQAGQMEVEDRDMDLDRASDLDGLVAASRRMDDESALGEQLLEERPQRVVVFG